MSAREMRVRAAAMLAAATFAAVLQAGTAGAQTIAITGGRVHPVSGAPIENGTVLIRDGRIAAVGANVTIPADAQRIDATGKVVTPGLINGATALGLVEIGQVATTVDARPQGERSIAAAVRVWEALNPASALIAPAREEGITSVVVMPSGGLISGQAAFVDLIDGSVPQMVVRGPVAMIGQAGGPPGGTGSRAEVLLRLRELVGDARLYGQRRAEFDRGQSRELSARRIDLEALQPVVAGELPLLLHVDQASDIQAALRLASELRIRIGVIGGAEAWKVANELAAARVPVLTGATTNIPTSFAALGSRQENAALLRQAGVQVVLVGGTGEAFNVRNVRQEAGNAVAYGLPWEDALRGVTLAAAEVFGVADRYGTLEVGKVANVVVWSGDPLEFSSDAERVFVRGQEMREASRQRQLMERYRTPGAIRR